MAELWTAPEMWRERGRIQDEWPVLFRELNELTRPPGDDDDEEIKYITLREITEVLDAAEEYSALRIIEALAQIARR